MNNLFDHTSGKKSQSAVEQCRQVLLQRRGTLSAKSGDIIRVRYPWQETPRSTQNEMEALMSPHPSNFYTMAHLDLRTSSLGRVPSPFKLELLNKQRRIAGIRENVHGYDSDYGRKVEGFSERVPSALSRYVTSLSISPLPMSDDPQAYGAWISNTIALPGRKKRVNPRTNKPVKPTYTTWESILLDDTIANNDSPWEQVFATYRTNRRQYYVESILSVAMRDTVMTEQGPAFYTRELNFPTDSRDGLLPAPAVMIEQTRLITPSTVMNRRLVSGEPVNELARAVLDKIN